MNAELKRLVNDADGIIVSLGAPPEVKAEAYVVTLVFSNPSSARELYIQLQEMRGV